MREITSLDSQSLDSQSGVLGKPQEQDDVYNDSEVSTSGMRMRFRLDNAQQFRPDGIPQLAKRYWGSSELREDAVNF